MPRNVEELAASVGVAADVDKADIVSFRDSSTGRSVDRDGATDDAQVMDLENLKLTALVNGISLLKLPLLAFISPRVMTLSERQSVIRVRLDWRTKNHLGVMYFGALAMGAELSIAVKAVQEIQKSGKRVDFLFKDFKAEFLKRADGHVHFVCDEADRVAELIHQSLGTEDRLERKFKGYAFVPGKSEDPVMTYELTLSVKNRSRRKD